MRFMDFTSLALFVKAVDKKSITAAADEFNMVASAASKRISEIEKKENISLLVRSGRGVTPTPAGLMFYENSKSILNQFNSLKNNLKEYHKDGNPHIKLVANGTSIQQFLPKEISAYLSRSNKTRIDLIERNSKDIPGFIIDGGADIGIYHDVNPAIGVFSVPFKRDNLVLVVPAGHDLIEKQDIYFEEALDYDFLGYFPRKGVQDFLKIINPQLNKPIKVRVQVSNPGTRCNMVSEGLGLAIMPEKIARIYKEHFNISFVNLKDVWAARQLWICRNTHSSNECSNDFWSFLTRKSID